MAKEPKSCSIILQITSLSDCLVADLAPIEEYTREIFSWF